MRRLKLHTVTQNIIYCINKNSKNTSYLIEKIERCFGIAKRMFRVRGSSETETDKTPYCQTVWPLIWNIPGSYIPADPKRVSSLFLFQSVVSDGISRSAVYSESDPGYRVVWCHFRSPGEQTMPFVLPFESSRGSPYSSRYFTLYPHISQRGTYMLRDILTMISSYLEKMKSHWGYAMDNFLLFFFF